VKIYDTKAAYNQHSGKRDGTRKVWKETRCDFSGRIVDAPDFGGGYPAYYASFKLDYGDQDPCMGSDGEEFAFGQLNGVDVYGFLHQPYVIFDDTSGDTGETEMPAFLAALKDYDSLDGALRAMRIATAQKLINEGTITPESLGE
jgi:hypothetical protein